MQFTITIEVDDSYILEHLQIHNKKEKSELLGEINNILYLGCSSIDAMLDRALELPSDSWVNKQVNNDFVYNDHYPTNKDFPVTAIIQRAILNEIDWDKKTIDFARQCWAECAIKHNIITKE